MECINNSVSSELEICIKTEPSDIIVNETLDNDNFSLNNKLNKINEDIINVNKRTDEILDFLKENENNRLDFVEMRSNLIKSQEQSTPHISTLSNIYWDNIEKEFEPIHNYLKNILHLSGFDNYSALTSFNVEAFDEIENFARNEMLQFIPLNSNLINYFYIYSNNRGSFKIPNGHKFLLIGLKNFLLERGLNYFKIHFQVINNENKRKTSNSTIEDVMNTEIMENNEIAHNDHVIRQLSRNCNKKIKYFESITTSTTADSPPLDEYQPPIERKPRILPTTTTTSENDYEIIESLIKKYIKNNYDLNINSISVTVKTSGNGVTGVVMCPFCTSSIRIYTDRLKKRGNRWIISNFVTHFKSQHALPNELVNLQHKHKLKEDYSKNNQVQNYNTFINSSDGDSTYYQ